MDNLNYLVWIGPVIAAIVIIFVVFRAVLPIFRLKSQTKALLTSGVLAEATILQAQQTGAKLTIGGQEQWGVVLTLEVRPPGRPPYAAQTQTFVSLLQLPRIQPGAIPVKISPQNPTQVAVDFDAGFTAPAFSPASSPYAQPRQQAEQMLLDLDARHRDLVVRGESAQAKILQAQPTGITVNGDKPLMSLQVEVYTAARPPFQAHVQGVVAAQSVGKYQPGKMIWVRFDPADTTKLTIERSA